MYFTIVWNRDFKICKGCFLRFNTDIKSYHLINKESTEFCSVDINKLGFISADLEEDNSTFQIYTHPDIVGSVQATIDSAHDQLIVGAR